MGLQMMVTVVFLEFVGQLVLVLNALVFVALDLDYRQLVVVERSPVDFVQQLVLDYRQLVVVENSFEHLVLGGNSHSLVVVHAVLELMV